MDFWYVLLVAGGKIDLEWLRYLRSIFWRARLGISGYAIAFWGKFDSYFQNWTNGESTGTPRYLTVENVVSSRISLEPKKHDIPMWSSPSRSGLLSASGIPRMHHGLGVEQQPDSHGSRAPGTLGFTPKSLGFMDVNWWITHNKPQHFLCFIGIDLYYIDLSPYEQGDSHQWKWGFNQVTKTAAISTNI